MWSAKFGKGEGRLLGMFDGVGRVLNVVRSVSAVARASAIFTAEA